LRDVVTHCKPDQNTRHSMLQGRCTALYMTDDSKQAPASLPVTQKSTLPNEHKTAHTHTTARHSTAAQTTPRSGAAVPHTMRGDKRAPSRAQGPQDDITKDDIIDDGRLTPR